MYSNLTSNNVKKLESRHRVVKSNPTSTSEFVSLGE